MGQYRQWLHYRHVNQQLQLQKKQIEQAIAHNRAYLDEIATVPLADNNAVIQALTCFLQSQTAPSTITPDTHHHLNGRPQANTPNALPHTIPGNTLSAREEASQAAFAERQINSNEAFPNPSTIDPGQAEIDQQYDDFAPTEPQITLPWWLQRAALSATQSTSLDAQSIRTNRLVQRWLERWGRQEEPGNHGDSVHNSTDQPTPG